MTDDELTRLEALERAATRGPWATGGQYPHVGIYQRTDENRKTQRDHLPNKDQIATCWSWFPHQRGVDAPNAALIVAGRNALPALIAALREARAQVRIATEFLEGLAAQRGKDMRYPGEHATFAEDALIRMSVVDAAALARAAEPGTGEVG